MTPFSIVSLSEYVILNYHGYRYTNPMPIHFDIAKYKPDFRDQCLTCITKMSSQDEIAATEDATRMDEVVVESSVAEQNDNNEGNDYNDDDDDVLIIVL